MNDADIDFKCVSIINQQNSIELQDQIASLRKHSSGLFIPS